MKARMSMMLHSLQCSSKVVTWKFVITEELLGLIPMHGITTGQDTELLLNELLCLVIYGVPVLSGGKTGVIGKLNAKVSRMTPNFQCIIHKEVLCCKVLKMNYVLKRVV
jgi:hypothetical protein